MKITSHLLITASFFYFTACSEGDNGSSVNTEKPENVSTNNDPSPIIAPATDSNELFPSTTLNQAVNPAASALNQAVNTTTAAGMNPPHGEPGHRCDISVGAPLNSAPSNTNATQINTAQQPINSAQQPNLTPTPTFTTPPAQVPVAAGTNPPHGQPGHDCTIPVGAPLKK